MFMESNDLPLRGPSTLFEYMLRCSSLLSGFLFSFYAAKLPRLAYAFFLKGGVLQPWEAVDFAI